MNVKIIKLIMKKQRITSLPIDHEYSAPTISHRLVVFEQMKADLNAQKSRMDKYYNSPSLRPHLERFLVALDPFRGRDFRDYLIRNGMQHITNASLKYWEMFNEFFHPNAPVLAFFNAELPGAAMNTAVHYMKANYPTIPYDWRASSLVPDGSNTALGDRYGFYAHNREKWIMYVDNAPEYTGFKNDGDATKIENLLDLEKRFNPKCTFYSHDAGIDASSNFNEQETLNAKIHLGCAIAAFMTLDVGGMCIFKQYTAFELLTCELIIVYAQMFDEAYLVKPITSRENNSELYIVLKGFRGFPAHIRTLLINRVENFSMLPLLGDLGAYSTQIGEIAMFVGDVYGNQVRILKNTMDNFERRTPVANLQKEHKAIQAAWIKKYPVSYVKPEDRLKSN